MIITETVIASNLVFAERGSIFDNTTVATAIADRLVHNSEVILMEGPSYRTKNKTTFQLVSMPRVRAFWLIKNGEVTEQRLQLFEPQAIPNFIQNAFRRRK